MPKGDNFSCIPKEPLIKLDEKGQAPIVKYSMPHDTSYLAKSFVPLSIEEECFKVEHRKTGNINNYKRFEGKKIKEIVQILHQEFGNFKRTISLNNLQTSVVASASMEAIEVELNTAKPTSVKPIN